MNFKPFIRYQNSYFSVVLLFALFLILFMKKETQAIVPVRISAQENALDLTQSVTIHPRQGNHFQTSISPSHEGATHRIEVEAYDKDSQGWAVFSLENKTDQQLDRLIVVPHFRLVRSGLLWPDLGETRIVSITPSEGFSLDRYPNESNNDVFQLTLNPGAIVTFVAELSSKNLPKIYLWNPNTYKDAVNAYTLFQGIVIGISGLLALFLTILFVVQGTSIFPVSAALSWSTLAYVCVDFGFLNKIISISSQNQQIWRAATEVSLAAALVIFLFTYLNLNRWHNHFKYWLLAWLISLFLIAGTALYYPPIAAGIARISFAITVFVGTILIILLSVQKYDRAIMLIPCWLMVIFWTSLCGMAIFGFPNNDIVQPALTGGLVLVILLLGFTVIQHAFTGGFLQQGLLSDIERRALALSGSGDVLWDWDVLRDRVITQPDISISLRLASNSLSGAVRDWLPILHAEDRDIFRTLLDSILEHRCGRIVHDFRLRSADGHYLWFCLRARPVIGAAGEVIRCVGTMEDVTYHKKSEIRLMHDALHDNLTGLPNRQLFIDRLETIIALGKSQSDLNPTLFMINLDRFKEVNDRLGVSIGDTILLTLGRRLNRLLKPKDTLCRFSGNIFAFLLVSETNLEKIKHFADSLEEKIREPINFAKQEVTLTASIGFATWKKTYLKANDIIGDAELAMHQAKRLGGNRIEAFKTTFRLLGTDLLELEEDFQPALERQEFVLSYQPIINLKNGKIEGFQALPGWNHPKHGFISPSEFIAIAENYDLVFVIATFFLQRAVEDLAEWEKNFQKSSLFVSIDLLSAHLIRSELVGDIRSILMRTNVKPSNLWIGFSEAYIMNNPEKSLRILSKLKQLGVSLSLDNFGSGHFPLLYLEHFPFDRISVDCTISYSKDVEHNPFIKSIVHIANEFGISALARRIREKKSNQLKKMGFKYVQNDFSSSFLNKKNVLSILSAQQKNTQFFKK